jgi:hypothetical protein
MVLPFVHLRNNHATNRKFLRGPHAFEGSFSYKDLHIPSLVGTCDSFWGCNFAAR